MLRLTAGAYIPVSLLPAVKVNINRLWFTVFVGLSLLQSGFTDWCPMMTVLEKLGVPKSPKQVVIHFATRRTHDYSIRYGAAI